MDDTARSNVELQKHICIVMDDKDWLYINATIVNYDVLKK